MKFVTRSLLALACIGLSSYVLASHHSGPSSRPTDDQPTTRLFKAVPAPPAAKAEPAGGGLGQGTTTIATIPWLRTADLEPNPPHPGDSLAAYDWHGDAVADTSVAYRINLELKRVGCLSGAVGITWNDTSKRAMRAFNASVNATLTVDRADDFLLTLVQGHTGLTCGQSCKAGQSSSIAVPCRSVEAALGKVAPVKDEALKSRVTAAKTSKAQPIRVAAKAPTETKSRAAPTRIAVAVERKVAPSPQRFSAATFFQQMTYRGS
jgi:hypothetical protein